MTAYEFWMPLGLLFVAFLGTLYLHHEGKKLDARIEAARKAKSHPAE